MGLYFLSIGYREDFIGTYYAVSTGTSAILLMLMGKLSDRIGRVPSFYLTLAGNITGYAILLLSQNKSVIFLCAFLNGAATALRTVTSAPFLHENSKPYEREYVFSASSSYMLFGTMAGNVIGGFMPIILKNYSAALSQPDSYKYSIFISLFIMLSSAAPLFYIKNDISPAATDNDMQNKIKPSSAISANNKPAVEKRLYRKFVIYTFFIGCGAGLIVPFFNVYFNQKFGLASGEIGTIFMTANIITATVMLFTPLLTAKLGRVKSIMLMEISSLPFLLILGFSQSYHLCVAAYLIRNAFMNMNNPVFTNLVMDLTEDRERARVNSIVTLGDNFSRTVSTYISGIIMTDHGVSLPYVLTACFYSVAAFYVYFEFNKYEKSR